MNKYAVVKEKHPDVLVEPGSSAKSVRVLFGGKNRKIRGAKIQYGKEKNNRRPTAGISALNVAQFEFVWWALKLLCIVSTSDFVHVPSVALELVNKSATKKVTDEIRSLIFNTFIVHLQEKFTHSQKRHM